MDGQNNQTSAARQRQLVSHKKQQQRTSQRVLIHQIQSNEVSQPQSLAQNTIAFSQDEQGNLHNGPIQQEYTMAREQQPISINQINMNQNQLMKMQAMSGGPQVQTGNQRLADPAANKRQGSKGSKPKQSGLRPQNNANAQQMQNPTFYNQQKMKITVNDISKFEQSKKQREMKTHIDEFQKNLKVPQTQAASTKNKGSKRINVDAMTFQGGPNSLQTTANAGAPDTIGMGAQKAIATSQFSALMNHQLAGSVNVSQERQMADRQIGNLQMSTAVVTNENSPQNKSQIPMINAAFKAAAVNNANGGDGQNQIYQNQSQQQIKAKSQTAGKSFIKRKPSVTNSKGQITVIQQQLLQKKQLNDTNAQINLINAIRGVSNYSTSNAKNKMINSFVSKGEQSIDSQFNTENLNNQMIGAGYATTINRNNMYGHINNFNVNTSQNQKLNDQFGCLINTNQIQPAFINQNQMNQSQQNNVQNLEQPPQPRRMTGRIQSGKQASVNQQSQNAQDGSNNRKKIVGQLKISQQSSNIPKNSVIKQVRGSNTQKMMEKQIQQQQQTNLKSGIRVQEPNKDPNKKLIPPYIINKNFNNTQKIQKGNIKGPIGVDFQNMPGLKNLSKFAQNYNTRNQLAMASNDSGNASKNTNNNLKRNDVRMKHLETQGNLTDQLNILYGPQIVPGNPNNEQFGLGVGQVGAANPNLNINFGTANKGLGQVGFAPVHGSSSATNKVQKTFDFDLDSHRKVKREKRQGISTQPHTNSTHHTGANKKDNSLNRKMAGIIRNNNANGQKLTVTKPQKIKTQMNLTGPLPKHLLSPTTVTNQSQGKNQHSQYFDKAQEIVRNSSQTDQAEQYQNQVQQQLSQQIMSQSGPDLQVVSGNSPQNQTRTTQQYQVQLSQNGQVIGGTQTGGQGASGARAHHQILTQGGNTVININIDSNAFQQPQQPLIQDGQYQTQPTRESNHFIQNQINPQTNTNLQTGQNSLTRANQNPQINYLTTQNQRAGLDHGSNQASRTFQPAKRQNSSKMRQESVSSNKSRRNRQGSHNHRRSSSSSHMQQQMFQIQQLHNMSANQHQIYTQNQQTPQSNTQIIFQNIAKINEKLIQQQMQQTSGQINTNDQIQNKQAMMNNTSKQVQQIPKNGQQIQMSRIQMIKSSSQNKDQQNMNSNQTMKISNIKQIPKQNLNQTQQIKSSKNNAFNPQMQKQIKQNARIPIAKQQSNVQIHQNDSALKDLNIKNFDANVSSQTANNKVGSARFQNQNLNHLQNLQNRFNQEQSQNYISQSGQESDGEILQIDNINASQNAADYDQHLLNMENQISQNQIRLRNELQQIKNNNQSADYNFDPNITNPNSIQMNGQMQMDVDQQEEIMIENMINADNNFSADDIVNMSGSISGLQQYNGDPNPNQQQMYTSNESVNKSKQKNLKLRQQSHDNSHAQSIDQSQHPATQNSQLAQRQQQPVAVNRGAASSAKGRQKQGVSFMAQNNIHLNEINLDFESLMRKQLQDSQMGLAAAVHHYGTKKSFTTKNQNISNRMQTQNVQNLLREAKREMVIDADGNDQIQVGGNDLTMRKNKGKQFNFNGTQNLILSSYNNNFGSQQQKLQIQYGISPKNRNKKEDQINATLLSNQTYISNLNSNYKTNQTVAEKVTPKIPVQQTANQGTFGLGQINQINIIKKIGQQQNHNDHQMKNQFQQKHRLVNDHMRSQNQQQVQLSQEQLLNNNINNNSQQILQNQKNGPASNSQAQISQQIQMDSLQSYQIQQASSMNQSQSLLNSQLSEADMMKQQRTSDMPPSQPSASINNEQSMDNYADSQPSHEQPIQTAQSVSVQQTNNPSSNKTNMTQSQTASNTNQNLMTQQSNANDDQLVLPLSGPKVMKHFLRRPGLTEYEKSELIDYKFCYYLGLGSEKIKGNRNQQYNSGYDDERGDYNVVLQDHIAYRFQVIDFLGKGSFGQALKCIDHKTGETVAIKIIRNKKKFQHQAGVELKILIHLRDNDPDDTNNIIRIKDYCMFRKHLIISFELFSINLYEFIKNNNFEGVSLSLIRRFAIQILQALKYLKEEQLIHCDLKPENILLKSPDKSGIKVIDFGSSCFQNQRIYTYIQSRFYRAPEIVLGIPYTPSIDMWSFGCILTELFTGVPLFPGESEQEQLSLIMEVIGLPDQKILDQATRKNVFFDPKTDEPYQQQDSQGALRVPSSKPLDEILMCQSDSFHDFISRCLEWDPEKRITPLDALMHEWIIEGLPPQVLIHHKKMLGIMESETFDESNQNSQSIINELGGQVLQDQTDSQIQLSNDLATNDITDQQNHNDLTDSQLRNIDEPSDAELSLVMAEENSLDLDNRHSNIGKIVSNNLNQQQNHQQNIDFYGSSVKTTEMQEFGESGNKSFKQSQDFREENELYLLNIQNSSIAFDQSQNVRSSQKNFKNMSNYNNRDGAKQENFDKTGKNLFKNDKNMGMDMSAAIGNPDISRIMGQDMRGMPPLVTEDQQFLDNTDDQNLKSKTTNMKEILSQVNKKSKSTKNNHKGADILSSLNSKPKAHQGFQGANGVTNLLSVGKQFNVYQSSNQNPYILKKNAFMNEDNNYGDDYNTNAQSYQYGQARKPNKIEFNEANNALMKMSHARPQELQNHNNFRDPEAMNMDTEREDDEQNDQFMDTDHLAEQFYPKQHQLIQDHHELSSDQANYY